MFFLERSGQNMLILSVAPRGDIHGLTVLVLANLAANCAKSQKMSICRWAMPINRR